MSALVDNAIALRILKLLVTPFGESDAFKHGIVDDKGKVLRKASTLRSPAEKDAYNYLVRLVFNMKRIINKLPGEDAKLRNMVAAMVLVREAYNNSDDTAIPLMESNFQDFQSMITEQDITTYPEYKVLIDFFSEEGEGAVGGAPTNNVSGASVLEPKIGKKDIKKYRSLARRSAPKLIVGSPPTK
jgi:hypothetical protein